MQLFLTERSRLALATRYHSELLGLAKGSANRFTCHLPPMLGYGGVFEQRLGEGNRYLQLHNHQDWAAAKDGQDSSSSEPGGMPPTPTTAETEGILHWQRYQALLFLLDSAGWQWFFVGIILEAYSPLGCPARPFKQDSEPVVLEDPVVIEIAKKLEVSPAQVILITLCDWFEKRAPFGAKWVIDIKLKHTF